MQLYQEYHHLRNTNKYNEDLFHVSPHTDFIVRSMKINAKIHEKNKERIAYFNIINIYIE